MFDERFPGAFPIRVHRAELAPPFVRALSQRVPDAKAIFVTFEADPGATAMLVAHGALVRFEMLHMKGALP